MLRATVQGFGVPERIDWKWLAVVFLFFAAVGFLIYSNSLHASSHLDDYKVIKTVDAARLVGINALWNNPDSSKRRFFVDLTFNINSRFGGNQVEGYHWVNLVVHVGASFFAFLLTALTFRSPTLRGTVPVFSQDIAAFFVGLVFLCHPIQTEAVTYICQRYTSMASLFYLAGLAFYAAYQLWHEKISWGGAIASALAGFFCKESFYTFPLAVLLYDFCFFKIASTEYFSCRKREWGVFGALAVAAYFVSEAGSAILTYGKKLQYHLPRADYLMTQFGVLIRYIGLLFFPVRQNLDWDVAIQRSFFSWPVVVPLCVLLVFLSLAMYFFITRRHMIAAFSIAWFFLTLCVESSIFPLEDLMVEHRLCLPLFGFAFFLVFLFFFTIPSPRKYLYLFAYIVLLSFMTYQRNFVYATDGTLWSDAATNSPNKYRPWARLAIDAHNSQDDARAYICAVKAFEALSDKCEKDPFFLRYLKIVDFENVSSILLESYAMKSGGEDFDEIVDALYNVQQLVHSTNAQSKDYRLRQEAAYELDKDYSNIAIDFESRGLSAKAEALFKKAIKINPSSAANHSNYGAFLMKHGRYREAESEINRALSLNPQFEDAQRNMAALRAVMEISMQHSQPAETAVLDTSSGQLREMAPQEKELAQNLRVGVQSRQTENLRNMRELTDLRRIPKRI